MIISGVKHIEQEHQDSDGCENMDKMIDFAKKFEKRFNQTNKFTKFHAENQESLLSAIASGNKKKIRKIERKAAMGEMIRII